MNKNKCNLNPSGPAIGKQVPELRHSEPAIAITSCTREGGREKEEEEGQKQHHT